MTWRLLVASAVCLAGCRSSSQLRGESLARTYCSTCHAFPEPALLDKETWKASVLPAMAVRLGVSKTLFNETFRHPQMKVLTTPIPQADWERIVAYYLAQAPDSLPSQSLPSEPQIDPPFFKTAPFAPRMGGSGIITLLKSDSTHERVFIGEAGTNWLRVYDWHRRLLTTVTLPSPATDLIVEQDRLLVLESGILSPNDEPKGRLVEYVPARGSTFQFKKVIIDSLFRPVFVRQFDFDTDGVNEFIISEFGDNRGRLALYRLHASRYEREVIDASPGAIRFEIRDLTGDGAPDIVALFAQGDERIVLFENDGHGRFISPPHVLARFAPVYGSMHFSMHDFNGDGHLDILYVNGDNFDYSRVLKPYHGIRILENDGHNNFTARYFFPIYGAAQAEVADFDGDGDLDILASSNFADVHKSPERGIMFFENQGAYTFKPYAFTVAAASQWNVMTMADLTKDGLPDVIIGAMDLESITSMQRRVSERTREPTSPVLFFENRMKRP